LVSEPGYEAPRAIAQPSASALCRVKTLFTTPDVDFPNDGGSYTLVFSPLEWHPGVESFGLEVACVTP
jgi:hypothetical protein